MADPMKLEDLLPTKSEFFLTKKKKTYHLRLFDLNDHVWVQKTFESVDNFNKRLSAQDWGLIARTVYHLLVEKEDFLLTSEEIIDDMGRKKTQETTGPEHLLAAISGPAEANAVINALTASLLDSAPIVRQEVEKELKKKVRSLKKARAGQKSLTQSQVNTATRSSKSQG